MSKRSERKALQAAVERHNAVQLSQEQLEAASRHLIHWLSAWSTKNWGLMASLTQCPLVGKAKAQYIANQFATNILVDWEPDIMATKAMGDEADGKAIGYVDFAVTVLISNGKDMGRFGIFVRCILDGSQWMVNPHSINRRFDPKLADQALKEMEDDRDGDRDEDEDNVG